MRWNCFQMPANVEGFVGRQVMAKILPRRLQEGGAVVESAESDLLREAERGDGIGRGRLRSPSATGGQHTGQTGRTGPAQPRTPVEQLTRGPEPTLFRIVCHLPLLAVQLPPARFLPGNSHIRFDCTLSG